MEPIRVIKIWVSVIRNHQFILIPKIEIMIWVHIWSRRSSFGHDWTRNVSSVVFRTIHKRIIKIGVNSKIGGTALKNDNWFIMWIFYKSEILALCSHQKFRVVSQNLWLFQISKSVNMMHVAILNFSCSVHLVFRGIILISIPAQNL